MPHFRHSTTIAALICVLPWNAIARAPFCDLETEASYIDISGTSFASADFRELPSVSYDADRYQLDAMLLFDKNPTPGHRPSPETGGRQWLVSAGHEYNSFTFDHLPAPAPRTNGDLHTLYLSLHRAISEPHYRYRISLAPALSTSSNALKNPEQLESEALQLWGALIYQRLLTDQWSWLAGLCADHRMGHYQGYPVVGGEWQPDQRWLLRLAYPDTRIRFRFRPGLTLAMVIGPDGNQWHVFDRDLNNSSRFIREAWLAEGQLKWRPIDALEFRVAAGRQFDQRLRFTREDGSRLRMDTDDADYWHVGLRWYLP